MEKIKYEIEFTIHSSPNLLYPYLASPSGLSEWFADNVNSRSDKFIFIWDDSEEIAFLKSKKNNNFIRFQWEDDMDEEYFFEFKIAVDELTKDVSLIVTDFAEEDEIDEAKMLWEKQINQLKQTIGGS